MATRRALQDAIDTIDSLCAKLHSGTLISAGPAKAPTKPAKPATAPQPKPVVAGKQPEGKAEGKAQKPAKQAKLAAPAAAPASSLTPEEELFAKAHLAVAKVLSTEPHPSSDKLYVCKIDVGDGRERQVLTGLQKHVAVAELQGSLVIVVLNLKPAKLAGELSEAMILTACIKQADNELVRLLRPAEGAEAGQAVVLEGGALPAEYPKVCKQWSKILEGLVVGGGQARFLGRPLVTAAGGVTAAADMPDGAEIN